MTNIRHDGDRQIGPSRLKQRAALDVDDDASVNNAVGKVLAENGCIDVLVNNAGVSTGGGSVEEVPIGAFREVMETNFFGGLLCIKAVIPSMRERRQGCIVNVTSVAGRVAMAPQAAYAASKWAFEALSECLAQEMKEFSVRVVIIEPGVIATPIFSIFLSRERPKFAFRQALVVTRADSPTSYWSG